MAPPDGRQFPVLHLCRAGRYRGRRAGRCFAGCRWDGGSAEELLELRDPGDGASWEELLGACGRGVVTLYSTPDGGALTPPRRTEEMTDAEYDAARQAYGSRTGAADHHQAGACAGSWTAAANGCWPGGQSAAGDMGWLSAWRGRDPSGS